MGVASLPVVCLIFFVFPFTVVYADSEVDALLKFKNGLEYSDSLTNWDATADHCTWAHVTCDGPGPGVTRLDLGNAHLKGPLAPALGVLNDLIHLHLYSNNFNGTIPKEWGNFKNLKFLYLYDNKQLSGSVPDALANKTGLEIDISRNPGMCGILTKPFKACMLDHIFSCPIDL